jgi:hypothetical protein
MRARKRIEKMRRRRRRRSRTRARRRTRRRERPPRKASACRSSTRAPAVAGIGGKCYPPISSEARER